MSCKSVLISGAGIAGPTLAYWLSKYGFEPTIIEQSQTFRKGGYVVDFWGMGFDVAEKMNLIPELRSRGYEATELRLVDRNGQTAGGFNLDFFRTYLEDRFLSIQRGELASTIFDTVKDSIDTIFGDTITALDDTGQSVQVKFQKAADRTFDLVIGADGLHSRVRDLTFGQQEIFEKKLGYYAAAFSSDNYEPREPGVYLCYSTPGRHMARFALRSSRTVFFLIFSDKVLSQVSNHASLSHEEKLTEVFAGSCIESENILNAMRSSEDLYYDSVSQIRMPTWSKGRIALVGDAGACPSLLAGQGSSLAMAASYILAGELRSSRGEHSSAFGMYENILKDFILRKQVKAEKFGDWFVPATKFACFVRNQITKLLAIPVVANYFVQDSIADKKDLPEYD